MTTALHQTMNQDSQESSINEKRIIQNEDRKDDEETLYGWIVVLGSFLVTFVLFGIYGSYGVFLHEYQIIFPSADASTLSFVGSTGPAIFFFVGMVTARLSDYIHYKICLAIGGVIFCLGLLLASFATQIWHLFMTQSLLLGLGSSIIFFPAISAPAQWFTRRRSLAIGITVSGSGFGGLAFGPLTQLLIDQLNFRWALRILSLVCFVMSMIAVVLIKRKPTSNKSKKWINFEFILNLKFWLVFGMGFFISFAYWVPFFLIPLYCSYYGLSTSNASLLVGLLNLGSAIGRILLGQIADLAGNVNVTIVSCFVMALSSFVIWTFSQTFGSLVAFTLIFGASSSGLFVFLPILSAQIFGVENQSQVNGPLYFSMSVSFLFGSPVATAILRAASPSEEVKDFIPSIVYTGVMSIIGCIFVLILRFKLVRFKWIKI